MAFYIVEEVLKVICDGILQEGMSAGLFDSRTLGRSSASRQRCEFVFFVKKMVDVYGSRHGKS
ncbi:hypothetical protein RUE5091_02533 [Ruegeria denitrificans]|uniref:Uncharacterized protein n=1 Tax=Ruegeria denitrificans TaxID=1715692 RepID=A0A0P1IBR9_9RHOB|nr:hypothetical protein [Ruegeria denitrificans]CUK03672.1 hypothetical protein RUE5091_02533 [Ruegeria denitrificans]